MPSVGTPTATTTIQLMTLAIRMTGLTAQISDARIRAKGWRSLAAFACQAVIQVRLHRLEPRLHVSVVIHPPCAVDVLLDSRSLQDALDLIGQILRSTIRVEHQSRTRSSLS